MNRFLSRIKYLVNMSDHIDYDSANESIRKNIAFRGPNVVILACAIVIASVGLNVNSIPVIIGAMLISPVMGPILGFGTGLGTRDPRLVKDSLKNFVVMVVISIVFSTLYFLLSPLNLENPSELLARTNPSIYDVLIALFGGFAGILETSRKEKGGTVISGVAIATALMPPLCTVGYGLSLLNFSYIAGALYLFLINSIFIALATFVGVKYLGYPTIRETDLEHRPMSRRVLALVLAVILVPSLISAVRIVKENNFKIHADKVVSANKAIGRSFIYNHKVEYSSKAATLELFIAGEPLSESDREKLYADAEAYGITRSQILIHDDATVTRESLSESELVKGIYERSDRQVSELNRTIAELEAALADYRSRDLPYEAVSRELYAQYPAITDILLSEGSSSSRGSEWTEERIVAIIKSEEPLEPETVERIENWLKVRIGKDNILIINE